jgi:hypothetical protein
MESAGTSAPVTNHARHGEVGGSIPSPTAVRATTRGVRSHNEKRLEMKSPDWLILIAAFASFLFSVYLWFQGQRDEGLFVGIWVPSILALGGFIKLSTGR